VSLQDKHVVLIVATDSEVVIHICDVQPPFRIEDRQQQIVVLEQLRRMFRLLQASLSELPVQNLFHILVYFIFMETFPPQIAL
jgi:hypothetical protein